MFELTDDRIALNVHISAIAAGASIACVLAYLSLAAWAWSVPRARVFLDRVSFRLLVWVLSWELVYDVNYIASVLGSRPDKACAVGIYFMIGTLGVVNFLCTSIAVNLAITIVLGANPLMLRLEKWYILASVSLGLFIPIVPAALGHFGWDPLFGVCWIRASNDKDRVRNLVLDLYLWQLLTCALATLAVAATLIKLFRQGRATSKALFGTGTDSLNLDMSDVDHSEEKPGRGPLKRARRRRRLSHDRQRMFGHLEDRFISIALRISTYPIALVVVNGIIAIGDIYISSQGGVHSRAAYGLYCLYYFLYGARGMVFVALGLFVDPCLLKGVRAALEVKFPPKQEAAEKGSPPCAEEEAWWTEPTGMITPTSSRVDQLADSNPNPEGPEAPRGSMESAGSMDVMQALFMSEPPAAHLTQEWTRDPGQDEEGIEGHGSIKQAPGHWHMPHPHFHVPHPHLHFPHPHLPHLPWFLKRHLKKHGPEKQVAPQAPAFPGLAALPEGMEDGADDVVHPEALRTAAEADRLSAALANASARGSMRSKSGVTTPLNTPAGLASPPNLGPAMALALGRRPSMASAGSSRRQSIASQDMVRGSFSASLRPSASHASGRASASMRGAQGLRWTPSVRRGSADPGRGVLGIVDERRARKELALDIAERLYEEMEAQL